MHLCKKCNKSQTALNWFFSREVKVAVLTWAEMNGSHTLEHLAELTATCARLLSRFLLCAENFCENFALRNHEENDNHV